MAALQEFTIKKLAEVQAFNGLGNQITGRAGEALAAAAPQAARLLDEAAGIDLAPHIAEDQRVLFDDKTAKTTAKLQHMMDLYIGDEWDNPVEVLEWSSFYAGAGAAHSALTGAAADGVDAGLASRLEALTDTYQQLLQAVMDGLRAAARQRR